MPRLRNMLQARRGACVVQMPCTCSCRCTCRCTCACTCTCTCTRACGAHAVLGPRLRAVLQALRVRHTLPPLLHRANTALGCVAEATRQIMASAALVSLLQGLLAHGNFVNAGTPRGDALGVKLDGIEKANSLRTQVGFALALALTLTRTRTRTLNQRRTARARCCATSARSCRAASRRLGHSHPRSTVRPSGSPVLPAAALCIQAGCRACAPKAVHPRLCAHVPRRWWPSLAS